MTSEPRPISLDDYRAERAAEKELGYEPAPVAFNLARARAMLAHLHLDGVELEETDPGPCDDCHREGARFRYGTFRVCSGCSRYRLRVRRSGAA
jgi:hypothetical protein